jgi:predicted unusual protein kinase regulating ubiquinone biosynthesis (AarF/ABC1/UbiB family)
MKLPALHLKRYRQIAALLWKYGRTDLAQQMSAEEGFGIDQTLSAEGEPLTDTAKSVPGHASPEQLADDLEAMGPTYVKLGQVLAGRPAGFAARRLSEGAGQAAGQGEAVFLRRG